MHMYPSIYKPFTPAAISNESTSPPIDQSGLEPSSLGQVQSTNFLDRDQANPQLFLTWTALACRALDQSTWAKLARIHYEVPIHWVNQSTHTPILIHVDSSCHPQVTMHISPLATCHLPLATCPLPLAPCHLPLTTYLVLFGISWWCLLAVQGWFIVIAPSRWLW